MRAHTQTRARAHARAHAETHAHKRSGTLAHTHARARVARAYPADLLGDRRRCRPAACGAGDTTRCTDKLLIPRIRSLLKVHTDWRRAPEGAFKFDGKILEEFASAHFVRAPSVSKAKAKAKAKEPHAPRACGAAS